MNGAPFTNKVSQGARWCQGWNSSNIAGDWLLCLRNKKYLKQCKFIQCNSPHLESENRLHLGHHTFLRVQGRRGRPTTYSSARPNVAKTMAEEGILSFFMLLNQWSKKVYLAVLTSFQKYTQLQVAHTNSTLSRLPFTYFMHPIPLSLFSSV